MPATFSAFKALPAIAVIIAASACGGDNATSPGNDENVVYRCLGGQPCPDWGESVSLGITRDTSIAHFPPRPQVSAAVFPGEEINVVIQGFTPGEQARILSTHPAYHGLTYRPDDDGVVRFPVSVGLIPGDGAYYFLVVQQPSDSERAVAAVAGFILSVINPSTGAGLPWDEAIDVLGQGP